MLKRIINYLDLIKKINIFQFIYLNFFSKQVIRLDNSKIIPYKGAIIDLSKECRIYLCNGDIEIGTEKLKKSKIETLLRMRGKSIWSNTGGCSISYGSTVEILHGAVLDSGYFTMNSRSVMIVAFRITLGNDVMIARNVILYDSDFHKIYDNENNVREQIAEIVVGDHVWITTNVTILKGSHIQENSIISTGTIFRGNAESNMIISDRQEIVKKKNYGVWKR